jgi:hypothetical protein
MILSAELNGRVNSTKTIFDPNVKIANGFLPFAKKLTPHDGENP